MYFLVFPPKQLDIATANFAGTRLHDVEGLVTEGQGQSGVPSTEI